MWSVRQSRGFRAAEPCLALQPRTEPCTMCTPKNRVLLHCTTAVPDSGHHSTGNTPKPSPSPKPLSQKKKIFKVITKLISWSAQTCIDKEVGWVERKGQWPV
jgi:hypothetical protein